MNICERQAMGGSLFGQCLDRLDGCALIPHAERLDGRGFFKYVFRSSDFGGSSLLSSFVPAQVNHSFSSKSVLRGIHREAWSKLIYVPSGRARVCVVNLVPDSPQFGAHMFLTLGDFDGGRLALRIPPKFGNAFYCLEDTHYFNFVDQEFFESGRSGLMWNDPTLNISWDLPDEPILSQQDSAWPLFGRWMIGEESA